MLETRRKSSDPRAGWIPLAAICAVAVLFGVFVLPRLSSGLEGRVAPDLALPVIHGGEPGARVKLSDQKGKLVLLDFWASWCRPCREQNQVLEAVRRKHQDLMVIGVNVSDSPAAARAYLEQVKPAWIVVEDAQGDANAAYAVEALPTLVAIDREGKIFAVRRRFVPERELSAMIEAMAQ